MAFDAGSNVQPGKVGAGEVFSDVFTMTETNYDAGIKTGKFAAYDAGVLKTGNTGTLAGVVLRDLTSSIEASGNAVDEAVNEVQFMRAGAISVSVKASSTPSFGSKVYVADTGLASTDITDTEFIGAEFIREVNDNVWLIRMK